MSLGEKIRQIYATILEDNPMKRDKDKNIERDKDKDIEFLTQASLKDFEYKFDDLKLAQLMMEGDKNREFYDLATVQKIIDAQFDISKQFYEGLLKLYIITFIVPLIVSFFVGDLFVTKICYIISLISLALFFIIEICQLRQLGLVEYLYDIWNIVDSTQFIIFCYLTYGQLMKHTSEDGA